jgi:hypothetical protein
MKKDFNKYSKCFRALNKNNSEPDRDGLTQLNNTKTKNSVNENERVVKIVVASNYINTNVEPTSPMQAMSWGSFLTCSFILIIKLLSHGKKNH